MTAIEKGLAVAGRKHRLRAGEIAIVWSILTALAPVTDSSSPSPNPAARLRTTQDWFAYGKKALEQGFYQDAIVAFQTALSQGYPDSYLGGEIQIWLATAYEAKGENKAARDLCRQLQTHSDVRIRKQSADILYIWEAPVLSTRPDWIVEIPDLTQVEDNPIPSSGAGLTRKKDKSKVSPLESDLPNVSRSAPDHQFTIVAILIILAGLVILALKGA